MQTHSFFRLDQLKLFFLGFVVLTTLAAFVSSAQAQPMLGPTDPSPPVASLSADAPEIADLRARAIADGTVRVIVGLDVSIAAEGRLSRSAVDAQHSTIRAAQDAVLARVPEATVNRRYVSVPALALDVTEKALIELLATPGVSTITEDAIGTTALKDSTRVIGARRMWANGNVGTNWAVAVLDTGIMYGHRAFDMSRIAASACFSTNSAQSQSFCPGGASSSTARRAAQECPMNVEGCGHGTHVAATVAGAQNNRFQGVAPGANLIPIQMFSRFNASSCGGTPCARYYHSDLMAALDHVLQLSYTHQIAAVNMSLQGGRYYQACSNVVPGFTQLTENLTSRGILLVAASGNSGWSNSQAHPSCDPWIVSVGATNNQDAVAGFTNLLATGAWLMAPGVDIEAAYPPGKGNRAALSGTSMASPHVAGAVALLRSVRPRATGIEIYTALFCSGKAVARPGLAVAFPRIQLPQALRALRRGTTC